MLFSTHNLATQQSTDFKYRFQCFNTFYLSKYTEKKQSVSNR